MGNGDRNRSGQISGGLVTVKEEETEEGSGSGNRDGDSGVSLVNCFL